MPNVVFAGGQIKHEHEDFATIMLGYKDNKVAIITSNWITPKELESFTQFVMMQGSHRFHNTEIKVEKRGN